MWAYQAYQRRSRRTSATQKSPLADADSAVSQKAPNTPVAKVNHPAYDAWFTVLPTVVAFLFFISVPISSYAFVAVRECDCFVQHGEAGMDHTVCFSQADYDLRCPASAGPSSVHDANSSLPADQYQLYNDTTTAAYVAIGVYAVFVPVLFATLLVYCRHSISGKKKPTRLSQSLSFLYSEYHEKFFWWELAVTAQKQYLVGVLSLSMFEPGHPIQLLLAIVFLMFFLMFVGWFQPYRKAHLNVLAVLSTASLQFIFLAFLSFELSTKYGIQMAGPVRVRPCTLLLVPRLTQSSVNCSTGA